MPSYGQADRLGGAVRSLLAQTDPDWELVVVDDGSLDDVAAALAPFDADARIRLHRLASNRGLGAACNRALDLARAALVAYLPCDDRFEPDHLATLRALLADPGAVLAHTALPEPAFGLQLVQVMHRRTADRWVERDELESVDLDRLLWARLRRRGRVAASPRVTCRWVAHPGQRHRAIRASCDGGLNTFRARYGVRTPLRFHPSDGPAVDEVARYARFRDRPPPPADGLRVLLAGELAYNPERILALEERGCRLSGLWIDDPLGFMTVGPLPFGHVEDVAETDLHAARPDVVLALLNWRAVPLAHRLLDTGVPVVWHFKEAPQRCDGRGETALLDDLHRRAAAVIYSSEEERAYCALRFGPRRAFVIDGDLPKREWLDAMPARRLSEDDGAVHTVLLGRPYGVDRGLLDGLAARGIAVHVHDGPTAVGPEDWVSVLSRYDGGWLHPVRPANGGDLGRATWDDLNLPARLPTLLAAGVPPIAPAAPGAVSAVERVLRETGAGVLYRDLDDLAAQLRDATAMAERRARAWAVREQFTFDHHADGLVALLRAIAGT